MKPKERFLFAVAEMRGPRVLEIGTARADPEVSTIRRHWVPHASEYLGLDAQSGPDVDIVADAHRLTEAVGQAAFDAIVCCSALEHIERPWIVAEQIALALKPGGWLFIHTHQTFPIHAFPHDYWRFSREGLEVLFNENLGFVEISSDYDFPCKIISDRIPENAGLGSFLNVTLCARKADQRERERERERERRLSGARGLTANGSPSFGAR